LHLNVFQHLISNINNSSFKYQGSQIQILQRLACLELAHKIIILLIIIIIKIIIIIIIIIIITVIIKIKITRRRWKMIKSNNSP